MSSHWYRAWEFLWRRKPCPSPDCCLGQIASKSVKLISYKIYPLLEIFVMTIYVERKFRRMILSLIFVPLIISKWPKFLHLLLAALCPGVYPGWGIVHTSSSPCLITLGINHFYWGLLTGTLNKCCKIDNWGLQPYHFIRHSQSLKPILDSAGSLTHEGFLDYGFNSLI